jgi:hypothetical protein
VPLSVDNIVQSNFAVGSFNAAGGNVTLPNPPAAGSTVVIITACPAISGDSNVMMTVDGGGFEAIGGLTEVGVRDAMPTVFAKRNVTDGTQTWGLTPKKGGVASARQVTWFIAEVTGVGLDPLGTGDLSWYANKGGLPAGASDATSIDTFVSGSSSAVACYDTLSLAVFAARSNDATVPTFSGYTNDWLELANVGRTDSGVGFAMAVAYKPSLAIGYQSTAATVSPTSDLAADAVSLYADGARHVHTLQMMTGGEFGNMTGAALGSAAISTVAIFDSATANITCVTNIKRTGNYALKYASSSAPANTVWCGAGVLGALTGKLYDMTGRALPARLNIYFETSLPGVDVELATFEAGSLANGGRLTYRTASQKLELKLGTGTAVLSDAVIAANQWIGVDLRYDPRCLANAQHICDWQVDYNANLDDTTGSVLQTQSVGAGTTAATLTKFRKGWTQSITATVYMDDLVVSRVWGAYPLGDLRLHPLKVDAAGTPTLVGTAANFKVFSSNGGTLSTWTAAGTVNALRDVPPTIGSISDGLTQVTAAGSDYVEVPLETYDAAGNGEAIRGLGFYAAGWAASGTAAAIGLTPQDGRTGVDGAVGLPPSDHGFDASALVWIHLMHRAGANPDAFYPIFQSHLDAMALQAGFSLDTTPDAGWHCYLGEVATQPLTTWPIGSGEADTFRLYGQFDPVDSKIAGLIVTTPAGTRGATVQWAIRGVDQTPQYVAAGQVQTFLTGAESVEDVTSVGFMVDASPPEV